MTARVTTGTHFRRGRPRAQTINGASLPEEAASIIAVELNRRTEGYAPSVESRQDVIFAVSLDADGIWRIERFNRAFVEIFSAPHNAGCNGAQYTLPLAFATKLAGALSRCAENGEPVGLDVSVRTEGRVHHWEFLLESAQGPDALPHHILVHGHDVTSQHQTERDLKRTTEELLNAQDDERRSFARDLHDSTAQHLIALEMAVAHLEALSKRQDNLSPSAGRKVIADMRTALKQAHSDIRTLSLLLHPPKLGRTRIADALRRFVAAFARRTGIQAKLVVDKELQCRSSDAATTLMRITQEALTNICRHADATEVTVELSSSGGILALKIEDNGKGFASDASRIGADDAEAVGVGISGMRARVRHLDGHLFVKNGSRGVVIMAILPDGPCDSAGARAYTDPLATGAE